MTDQLISFETAKLAKAKGFNKLCFYYYNKIGKLIEPYEENGSSTDVEFRVDLTDLLDNYNNKYYEYYSAPTQSLLQKWLREVHNVHVWVTYNYPINGKYVYVLMFRNSIETFNSYEEALEQGLIEALKLIS